jgi:hypothetical protein
MAKRRRKTNLSQAIRDYLDKRPAAMPKEIQAALADQGLKVSYSLISQVKYKPPQKGKRQRARVNGRRPSRSSTPVSFELLVAAKALAERMGGVKRAKEALSMLERLQ